MGGEPPLLRNADTMRTPLLLSLALAGSSLAGSFATDGPFREGLSQGPGRPAGFTEAIVREPTLARVQLRSGDFEFTVIPKRVRVELVDPDRDTGDELRAVLPDGRTVWLPPDALREAEEAATLTPAELLAARGERRIRPVGALPPGVRYSYHYREGARLHLVVADLRQNPQLELFPVVTDRFHQSRQGRERVARVRELAGRHRAIAALNGPFFIAAGRQRGQPLGTLIAGQKVLWDLEDQYVLQMHRTYLAYTTAGRFVLGETSQTGAAILRKNKADAFDREILAPGERIVSLVGGMGRLVKAGDPQAWRRHADEQFSARYYSRWARRPQALVGIDGSGRKLFLLVQEGKPHSERCFTLPELGHVLSGLGAREVAFSDGGGSAELVVRGRELVRTERAAARRPNSSILVLRERSAGG